MNDCSVSHFRRRKEFVFFFLTIFFLVLNAFILTKNFIGINIKYIAFDANWKLEFIQKSSQKS